MMEHKRREDYIDDEFVYVYFEEMRGLLFVHVDVKVSTPSVIKYCKALWEQIKWDAWHSGYDEMYCYTPNIKFAKVVAKDYIYIGHDDVLNVDVIKWELNYGN